MCYRSDPTTGMAGVIGFLAQVCFHSFNLTLKYLRGNPQCTNQDCQIMSFIKRGGKSWKGNLLEGKIMIVPKASDGKSFKCCDKTSYPLRLFSGPFAVIDHHLDLTLPKCHDAVCLMLMICITRKHQVRRYKHNVSIFMFNKKNRCYCWSADSSCSGNYLLPF